MMNRRTHMHRACVWEQIRMRNTYGFSLVTYLRYNKKEDNKKHAQPKIVFKNIYTNNNKNITKNIKKQILRNGAYN